jgi:tripartite-type tricarboxylate transporter receptor subunit TctC
MKIGLAMGKKMKLLIVVGLAGALFVMALVPSAEAAYPEKEITLIIPWDVGGGTDLVSRAVARLMEEDLGKPVVVVNRPGGGGVIGYRQIAAADPDGYTLGSIAAPLIHHKYIASTYADQKSFTPIALFNMDSCGFIVKADAPWKTLKEALDFAKQNPRKMRVATSGPGGALHVTLVMLENATGLQFTTVPYGGSGPASVALAGGHVEASTDLPSAVHALIESGKLRVLAVTSEKRDPEYPDIPTFKESGVDLTYLNWRGIAGPKGMSKEITTRLANCIKKVVDSQKFKDFMKNGHFGYTYRGPEEFSAFMDKYEKDFAAIAPKLGVKK